MEQVDQVACEGAACGDESIVVDADTPFLAPVGDGWFALAQGQWELPPATEGYRCVRFTVPQDVYVTQFRPLSPAGTHHTAMGINTTANQPDGVTDCSSGDVARRLLSASGVGTGPTDPLPAGVAFKLQKGEQLLLNLHLFNATDAPLRGVSGTLVRTIPADQVEHAADALIAGPLQLDIPVGEVTTGGVCTVTSPSTIVQIFPHMHQLGVHMKVMVERASGEAFMLWDAPYQFEQQPFFAFDPIDLEVGDTLEVSCTYNNTTDAPVGFGDSSLDEMCFAYLVRYPAPDTPQLVCAK